MRSKTFSNLLELIKPEAHPFKTCYQGGYVVMYVKLEGKLLIQEGRKAI